MIKTLVLKNIVNIINYFKQFYLDNHNYKFKYLWYSVKVLSFYFMYYYHYYQKLSKYYLYVINLSFMFMID